MELGAGERSSASSHSHILSHLHTNRHIHIGDGTYVLWRMITTRRLVTLQPRTVSISRTEGPPPPGKTHLDLIWGKICLLREKEEGSRRRSDCSRASAAWFNLAADSVADHLYSSYFGRWVRVNAEEEEKEGGTEGRKEDNLFTEMEEKGNIGSQITILQIFWQYIDSRQWNNQLNIEIRYKLRPSSDFKISNIEMWP